MANEKSTDSSVCDPNKFSDEIKYLREENNTKYCIIQTLLENQKKHGAIAVQNQKSIQNTYLKMPVLSFDLRKTTVI